MTLSSHRKPGYILLMSVLITAVILFQFTILGLQHLARERQIFTAFYNKRLSHTLTRGCMEHAINSLGRLATYTGNETYAINGNTCTIWPIIVGTNTWTVETSATVGQQTTRMVAVLSSRAPVTISSWQEVTTLP